jgi:hypothetical protein
VTGAGNHDQFALRHLADPAAHFIGGRDRIMFADDAEGRLGEFYRFAGDVGPGCQGSQTGGDAFWVIAKNHCAGIFD